ncbi:MAG: fumarylacetoacetate hydrolase family protein [Lachnospiraceae bacterium]
MKFITYLDHNQSCVGILSSTEATIHPISKAGLVYPTMNALLDSITEEELHELKQLSLTEGTMTLEDVQLQSPIPEPKQDIICLGINYMAHAVESARYKQEAFGGERPFPVYFSKRVNEAVPDGGFVDGHFDILECLDYEAELAVVIGKTCSHVSKENAKDYIFGYTILNDISARDIQTRHKQWYFGKSLDNFTPIGPWIVTADEISYPPKLSIQSYVNGELRQNGNTELLIFDIDYIISELSQGMTLKPGTIISTGTPAGVGMGFQPPKFLKSGDVVECRIEGIGSLTNTMK